MVHSIRLELLGSAALYLAEHEHLHRVGLPTQKALGLLAYLALSGPTTRSKLANLFWSEQAEDEARKNLRQEVYRLQDTPLGEWLEAERTTLGLKQPFSSDVEAFEALLGEGQTTKALELYRGPLLDGIELRGAFEFEDWLEVERERLAQRYREALLAQAQAQQEAGNLREALAIFRRLLKEDELQELYHREVMRLHYLLGERSEALAQFERCREVLWEELALEPLPETQALESLIRSSQGIEAPSQTPVSQRLILNPIIVGREELWSALESSSARLKLLIGEAGIGKTRLAEEYARSKGKVLLLKGREVSSGTPFYPISEALWGLLEQQPSALDALPQQWRSEVERLLPGKSHSTPEPEGRGRFLEGLSQALLTLLGENGYLVIDDLHWWDAPSIELLGHLLGRNKQLSLIATARPQELEENPQVGKLLQGLAREDWLRLEVEGLSEQAVQMLVGQLSGNFEAALFAKHLHSSTSGNPFFVLETLRHLIESGELYLSEEGWATPYDDVTQDYRELPIPPGIHEAVGQRIGRLGAAAKRLLEAAALAGDGFELELLSEATALTDWEGLEALESTVTAQLIQPGNKGYRFVHDIVRRSLDGALNPERRKLIHRKLAASLEHLKGAAAQIAYHLEQSTQYRSAIPWRVKAAEEAAQVYAYREALNHYQKALDHGPAEADALQICKARLELWRRQEDRPNQQQEVEAMQTLAASSGESYWQDEVVLAQAELAHDLSAYDRVIKLSELLLSRSHLTDEQKVRASILLGRSLFSKGKPAESQQRLEAALPLATNPLQQAQIRLRLSIALSVQGKTEAAWEHNQSALHYYQTTGDKVREAGALHVAAALATHQDRHPQAIELAQRGLALAREAHFPGLYRQQLVALASALVSAGKLLQAVPLLEEAAELARQGSDAQFEARSLGHMAFLQLQFGDLGAALRNSQSALKRLTELKAHEASAYERLNLTDLMVLIGEPTMARSTWQQAEAFIREHNLSRHLARLEAMRIYLALMHGEQNLDLSALEHYAHNKDLANREWGLVMVMLAKAQVQTGAPREALETLARMGNLPRYRALTLSARLEAQSAMQHFSQAAIEEGQTLVADEATPVWDKLDLYKSMVKAVEAHANHSQAQTLLRQAEGLIHKIAATLPVPEQKHFLAYWMQAVGLQPPVQGATRDTQLRSRAV